MSEDEKSHDPGFYLPALLPAELEQARQGCRTLDEEIALARVCLLRVAEALKANGKLTPEQRIRLASLIFRGTSTIAKLLRDRQAVQGEAADSLSAMIRPVLDEVARLLEVKL